MFKSTASKRAVRRTRSPRLTRTLLLGSGVVLMLSACASTAEPQVASLADAQTAPAASSQARPDDGGLAFAKCMRTNGVDFPDPDPDGGFGPGSRPNVDRGSEQFQQALEACQELRANGGRGDRTFDAQSQQSALELAKCMREAGFDFADPQFDANGNRIQNGQQDRSSFQDPRFRTAIQACREASGLEPGPGRGQGGPAA